MFGALLHNNNSGAVLAAPVLSGAVQRTSRVRRIPVTTRQVKRTLLKGKPGGPRCIAWRTEGDRLLCGLASGEVAAFSLASLECDDMKRILAASGEISAVTALRGFDCLIFGDSSGKLHFAKRNFAPQQTISIYSQPNAVYAIEPNPSDTLATVAVKAAAPALVDLARFQAVGLFTGLGFETSCVAWHPRRQILAAGSRTRQVQLWDPRDTSSAADAATNASVIASSFAHQGPLQAVKWHPFNDFKLLTCAKDQLICVWDIRQTGTNWVPFQVFKAKPEIGSGSTKCPACQDVEGPLFHRPGEVDLTRVQPTCLAWHPWDGEMFVVGDSLGLLSFYRESKLLCRVDQTLARQSLTFTPPAAVEAVQWHPQGHLLAATSPAAVHFWGQPPLWEPLCDPPACAHALHFAPPPQKQNKTIEKRRRSSLVVSADSILNNPSQETLVH